MGLDPVLLPDPESMPMAKRRRQYIVDRSFQFKYTVLLAVIGGIVAALFAWWMWDVTRTSTELLLLADIPGGEALREQMRADQAHLPWIYVGITLFMMSALGLLGVLITHRVAGPTFVIGRYLSVVADGAYPSLRPLRKRDELKEFFDIFERTVNALKDRDREEADALDAAIDKLEAAGGDAEALAALKRVRDRKRQSVAGATIEPMPPSAIETPEANEATG
jgi:hypothetical protein